jgi:N-acetylglucosaminyldiphosphoundecaprenol N-acetyl-beta-D-mannosaminyltransferase
MLLGYNVFKSSLENIDLNHNKIINTINPHSYCISKQDKVFEKALETSDILLPDGIGIVWAEKFLNQTVIQKIAGYDLFLFLMQQLEKDKGSVFFLGASNETLNKIEAKCKIDFPNVSVCFYSPPYKSEFSSSDSIEMCNAVNSVQPDVLFIGMTAPKQEKWLHRFKDKLEVKNICCIGAVFDFYTGNIKRSSDFWISLGLEWLPRLLKEPRRLLYRNFVSTPKFILEVLSFKIFGKGIL